MDSSKVVFAAKGRSVVQHENPSQGLNSNIVVAHRSNLTASKENPSAPFMAIGRMEDSSETASNLRAFRMLFGDEEEETEDKDEFLGFHNEDDIVKSCRLLRARIIEEIKLMKKQIKKPKLDAKKNLVHADNIQKSKPTKCTGDVQDVTGTGIGTGAEAQIAASLPTTTESESSPIIEEKVDDASKAEIISQPRISCTETEVEVASKAQATKLRKLSPDIVEHPLKFYDLKQCSVRIAQSSAKKAQHKNSALCDLTAVAVPVAVMPEPTLNDVKNLPSSTHKNSNNSVVNVTDNSIGPGQGQCPPATLVASVSIDPIVNEDFHGFSLDSPLRVACKSKLEKITSAIDRQEDFMGFSPAHPLRRKCILKLEKIMSELEGGNSFPGFSVDNPLREACIAKYRQIASDLSNLITVAKEKRVLRIPYKKPTPTPMPMLVSFSDAETETSSNDGSTVFGVHKFKVDLDVDVDSTTDSSSCDQEVFEMRPKVKVLIPNVKSNMSVVKKGPRIKSVRFFGGAGQKLPLSKFLPHQYPWNQSYDEPVPVPGPAPGDSSASCHIAQDEEESISELEPDLQGTGESNLVDEADEEMPFQDSVSDSE